MADRAQSLDAQVALPLVKAAGSRWTRYLYRIAPGQYAHVCLSPWASNEPPRLVVLEKGAARRLYLDMIGAEEGRIYTSLEDAFEFAEDGSE